MRAVSRGWRRACAAPKPPSSSPDAAAAALAPPPWPRRGPIVLATARFGRLPAEVALRLLGRAVAAAGDEGPVELGKLEDLLEDVFVGLAAPAGPRKPAGKPLRRTLAGAMVSVSPSRIVVERAPPRRRPPARRP